MDLKLAVDNPKDFIGIIIKTNDEEQCKITSIKKKDKPYTIFKIEEIKK